MSFAEEMPFSSICIYLIYASG
jgi:hypothetical protein